MLVTKQLHEKNTMEINVVQNWFPTQKKTGVNDEQTL